MGQGMRANLTTAAAKLIKGLALPVVCAPMFRVSGPDLIFAACSNGLIAGLPSANARDEVEFAEWMAHLTEQLTIFEAKGGRPGPVAAKRAGLSRRHDIKACAEGS
jgi:nitronate monooxygenase